MSKAGRFLHSIGEKFVTVGEAMSRIGRARRKQLQPKQILAPVSPIALLTELATCWKESGCHRESAALGCMLGAAVGDASGALLEFGGSKDVGAAMTMPGGGVFDVAPGQFTDDTELSLCLALGLLDSGGTLDLECIAARYRDWICSSPFDVGQATRHAFQNAMSASEMRAFAIAQNSGSKANGSLMRCMPLALWGHRLSQNQLLRCAFLDSSLSHPNPVCQAAVACYVAAAAKLIADGQVDSALQASHEILDTVNQEWIKKGCASGESEQLPADEVKGWLDDALNGKCIPYSPQDGFVRIAFTHAFRHLACGTSFTEALSETLAGFGDTDTNAAIVCGLLGARDGLQAIPQQMWQSVLLCDTAGGRLRPLWLSGSQLPEIALRLLHSAPHQIETRHLPDHIVDPLSEDVQMRVCRPTARNFMD
eukprot:gnl/MRDRNA2_/MRDRNA2_82693_c0_seq4.p1 gnl/MRDRNA2_/MRDRNA2_82693_c0~~gnl/MRDRNA2_/MRDRNA2_82693_c0_seq4.p1  ORF type:complete len:424 (-),score=73.02 gnl/MRDRNA2_/MRDRNA2_82693_c0_seq4:387-1658(-)